MFCTCISYEAIYIYSEMIILLGRRLVLVRFWIRHRWWNSSSGKSTQTGEGGRDVGKKPKNNYNQRKTFGRKGNETRPLVLSRKSRSMHVVESLCNHHTNRKLRRLTSAMKDLIYDIFNISLLITFFLTSSTSFWHWLRYHKGKSWRKKNL